MIVGLILAAGEGTRFGPEPKLLADLDGRPLLDYAMAAQSAVPELVRIVVVLGAHAGQLRGRVDFGRAEAVVCEDWRQGQSASLRLGLQELAGATKVVVTLGDQPLISAEVITRFVSQPGGTRAVYRGRPGHPAVLGPEQIRAALSVSGDRGARDLFRGGREMEVGHPAAARDVDTPADLNEVRSHSSRVRRPSGGREPEGGGGRRSSRG